MIQMKARSQLLSPNATKYISNPQHLFNVRKNKSTLVSPIKPKLSLTFPGAVGIGYQHYHTSLSVSSSSVVKQNCNKKSAQPFLYRAKASFATASTKARRYNNGRHTQDAGLLSTLCFLGASLLFSSSHINMSPTQQEVSGNNTNVYSFDDDNEVEIDYDSLPVYKLSDVALKNGQNGSPIWMTYGGLIYDVTQFIPNHPGGSEHIMRAAGSSIEPYWNLYRQHFATDLPMKLMEKMVIGTLDPKDQEKIDQFMERTMDENDPYKNEPLRHLALKVHGDQPMNAEVPQTLLTESYLTPNELFYIRHHHPVPHLTAEDIENYRLEIDLTALGRPIVYLTLKDIQSLKKHEITVTLQCSGNRRGNFNTVSRTSGTPWGQGAISTAKFAGPKLRDILKLAGLKDEGEEAAFKRGLEHVCFESLDGMKASIGIDKAISPHGDCIIAYEMNGKALPPDHGFPARIIVPGYCAVRNVKWLQKIQLSQTEADGAWQRGLNYKVLPRGVTDAKSVDLSQMPSLAEASLFSGITKLEQVSDNENGEKIPPTSKPGDEVTVKASGWAWAGGGRNIVRVNITGDGGKTWTPAEITLGKDQKFNRAWAWVFWSCDNIKATVTENNEVEICSMAVDAAMNSQPETCDHIWNIRGLGNNSWFRSKLNVN